MHQVSPTRVVATVTGDIDATNRQALGRLIERHIRVSRQLIVDLSDVDFFGSQGFAALFYISVHCARRDVDWMVVGNHSVRRILRICDSDGELPMVNDLATAHRRLDHLARCHRPAVPTHNTRIDRPSLVQCSAASTALAPLMTAVSAGVDHRFPTRAEFRSARHVSPPPPSERGWNAEHADRRLKHDLSAQTACGSAYLFDETGCGAPRRRTGELMAMTSFDNVPTRPDAPPPAAAARTGRLWLQLERRQKQLSPSPPSRRQKPALGVAFPHPELHRSVALRCLPAGLGAAQPVYKAAQLSWVGAGGGIIAIQPFV
jgi:anti-anti-sigma factor